MDWKDQLTEIVSMDRIRAMCTDTQKVGAIAANQRCTFTDSALVTGDVGPNARIHVTEGHLIVTGNVGAGARIRVDNGFIFITENIGAGVVLEALLGGRISYPLIDGTTLNSLIDYEGDLALVKQASLFGDSDTHNNVSIIAWSVGPSSLLIGEGALLITGTVRENTFLLSGGPIDVEHADMTATLSSAQGQVECNGWVTPRPVVQADRPEPDTLTLWQRLRNYFRGR